MPLFESGARPDRERVVTDRVVTVPNALSLLRLVGLPFAYVDIVNGQEIRAIVILFFVAGSDFVDGWVARRFGQVSRVGQLFDPISDRILIAVVAIAMIRSGIFPLWGFLVVLGRDALVVLGGLVMLSRGLRPPPVTDLGKAATFGLMLAFPMFLLASGLDSAQLRGSAWVLFGSMTFLYYLSLGQYVAAVVDPRVARSSDPFLRGR